MEGLLVTGGALQPAPAFLYRRAWWHVILAAIFLLPPMGAQTGRSKIIDKGPRALGLVQLAANGKGRIIPIAIMLDGKFYDAAAYKAAPVPMALEPGTVYEGFKTGVSQGLFTVNTAAPNAGSWVGEGTWRVAGAAPPPKKIEAAHNEEDQDRPPVLRHGDASVKATPPGPAAAPTPSATAAATPTSTPDASTAPDQNGADQNRADQNSADQNSASRNDEDADRPVLKRGKPKPESTARAPEVARQAKAGEAAKHGDGSHAAADSGKGNDAPRGTIRSLAAISDQGGPEARSYAYSMKASEEDTFKKKILPLASEALRAREGQPGAGNAAKPSPRTAGKAEAEFENSELRVFDLSSSNEPVLVLTASARLTGKGSQAIAPTEYFITIVAREDLYGELHKVLVNITDASRLDAIARMELIDAVDADGDGRGELLFRLSSGAGSAYSIYRVIGDQLYPLYEGAAGGE